MHARLKADLYAAGFTSQENLRAMLQYTTDSAGPPRIRPSMKRKGWVSWAVLVIAAALLVAML